MDRTPNNVAVKSFIINWRNISASAINNNDDHRYYNYYYFHRQKTINLYVSEDEVVGGGVQVSEFITDRVYSYDRYFLSVERWNPPHCKYSVSK